MSEMTLLEITHARIRVERRLREKGWGDSEVYPFLSWIVKTRFPEKGMITYSAMEDIERGLEALVVEFGQGKAVKLYIVACGGESHRGGFLRVLGVFSTEERAKQEAQAADSGGFGWQIFALVVDDVPTPDHLSLER